MVDIDHVNDVDCSTLKDRIVIFGFFGPGLEDTSVTPLDQGQSQTYRSLIIARIVSQLLTEFGSAR
jgi:CHASE2 domain-containing sensor protein